MKNHIAHIAILVDDYDEAIAFYQHNMKFILIEDTKLSEEKRWVLMKPSQHSECAILLAKAVGNQKEQVGNQSGGRVFLFLYTDNFNEYFSYLKTNHIEIVREPVKESYGMVTVIKDLYGNLWDVIEPAI
jgi:predicted enzyme related to lactoylglutathione lyase